MSAFGGPTITTFAAPLYAADDPWKAWLAPESACPGGERVDGPRARQSATMLCLLNYARKRQGLDPVRRSTLLSKTSAVKAAEIVRCDEFAHEPCNRPFDHAAVAAGYRGSFGENLYAAEGKLVSLKAYWDFEKTMGAEGLPG